MRGQRRCSHRYRELSYEISQICTKRVNQCVEMSKGTHDWMTCSFTAFQQYFSNGRIIINHLCSKTTFIVEKSCMIRLSNDLAVSFTENKSKDNHSPVQHFDLLSYWISTAW